MTTTLTRPAVTSQPSRTGASFNPNGMVELCIVSTFGTADGELRSDN